MAAVEKVLERGRKREGEDGKEDKEADWVKREREAGGGEGGDGKVRREEKTD